MREEPRGRERFYHLDPRPLSEVDAWLDAFSRYWKQRLVSLEKLLETFVAGVDPGTGRSSPGYARDASLHALMPLEQGIAPPREP